MAQFTTWFKKAVTSILDPDRESRVQTLASVIERGIQIHGQRFDLQPLLAGLDYGDQDLREAKRRVYHGALERGWSDGQLTAGEQRIAKWLSGKLELDADDARQ